MTSKAPNLLLFNKPFNVMCQFSAHPTYSTLADFIHYPDIYPAGRLDADSEGLVLLTADGDLQHRISDPKHKLPKTYWAQVEGIPSEAQLAQLSRGVQLKEGLTRPALARRLEEIVPFDETQNPLGLWPRVPPIRERKSIPVSWIELVLREGRNRQVRRMTAAVGLPTLRLIRAQVGEWTLQGLAVGKFRWENASF
jgi:23S rRNA pseudouridine2457 synthase